jgi:hypothetical protein
MNISECYQQQLKVTAAAMGAELKAALSANINVSKVAIENVITRQTLQLKLHFLYGSAKISAIVDKSSIWSSTNAYGAGEDTLVFPGTHSTIEAMLSVVQVKYHEFIKAKVLQIKLCDDEALTRRQRLFMSQTNFIDAGYQAEVKVLSNGDYRLIISHEAVRGPLKEITVK